MATAADVPSRFDVVINGNGYVFLDAAEPNRAKYTYTPTFLERTNVSGAYGDNEQAFFLTASQNNWDLGEQQRFYRANDPDRVRRYYAGSNIDVISVPGQATLRPQMVQVTFGGTVYSLTETDTKIYTSSATNLYSIDSAGTIVDRGAHGVGVGPSYWGMASDQTHVYLSASVGGVVRSYNIAGAAFSTFSATGADALCYVNNTLFGFRENNGDFGRYDTAGAYTSIYTWRDASGGALTGDPFASKLRPYGGKVLILRLTGVRRYAELWLYDGTATSQVADFPSNFVAQDMETSLGVVFVTGYLQRAVDKVPAIFVWDGQETSLLWRSLRSGYTNATWPAITPWQEGLAFTDDTTGQLMQYNIGTGGVSGIGSYTVTNAAPMMASNKSILLHTRTAATAYYYPAASLATSGTVVSSLFDYDNSLTKWFRGIRLDYTIASGSTSSFDIAYQTDSVEGSYTTLQTGALSGHEYLLSSVSGSAISVKVTINLGNASTSPILKRLYVRSAPILQAYRRCEYVLDLSASLGRGGRKLRDSTTHPKTGGEQAADLVTAVQAGPISITDRFGTFTGIVEPGGFALNEIHPGTDLTSSGLFVAIVSVREI